MSMSGVAAQSMKIMDVGRRETEDCLAKVITDIMHPNIES
jgi:hypothetical protein